MGDAQACPVRGAGERCPAFAPHRASRAARLARADRRRVAVAPLASC